MSFVAELKRRNVFRVAAAYAVVSWLLIQIVTAIEEPLGLPNWFDTAVIVLLAIGFPIALIFAWVFELTYEGIKPTSAVERDESITPETGHKLNVLIISVLSLAIVFLVIDNYVLNDDSMPGIAMSGQADNPETPASQSVSMTANRMPNSIAVLPLENLSPDEDDAYFAVGLHDEILNQLSGLSNMKVINRTTMSQYADSDIPLLEIAEALNVETVMEGTVRYASGRVRITTQLINGTDGTHLWSNTYERPFEDIFAIESDIAMNVANAMRLEFSDEDQEFIGTVPTNSTEAYALYLASFAKSNSTSDNWIECLAPIELAVQFDPEFVEAWQQKAICHDARAAVFADSELIAAEQLASQETLAYILETFPDFAPAHRSLSFNLASQGRWVEALEESRFALELGLTSINPADVMFFTTVGYVGEASEIAMGELQQNPLNSVISFVAMNLTEIQGRQEESDQLYSRGSELFTSWGGGHFSRLVILLGRRDEEALHQFDFESLFSADMAGYLDSPEMALARLRSEFDSTENANPVRQLEISTWAAYFGDHELALYTLNNSASKFALRNQSLWMPLYSEVRQLDTFKDHMRDIGMVDFWREYGWPDLCEPFGDDDFVCN